MKPQQEKNNTINSKTAAAILVAIATGLGTGWVAISKLAIDHNVPLPDAISAEKNRFYSQTAGYVNYYFDASGEGRPLLLIHSVNAAASAYEMRPLFAHFRGKRPVYAIDLPGFGFSDRTDREYKPVLYDQAITDLIALEIGEAVDAVALSLGSEFLARAALATPRWFNSIALLSPSGFNKQGSGRPTQRATASQTSQFFYRLFSQPLWGRAFFDLITTRPSLAYFLEKSFVGHITPGLVEYAYATSHQPGAEHAPLYFVSGLLFTRNAPGIVYKNVKVPGLIIYDEDFFSNFDRLPELIVSQENWQAVRLTPTRGLPHFEKPVETAAILKQFWQEL